MKKQILKIAGVKSEKEFYKKFPTEEAFMAKHGKELKKAQIGMYMTSESASTMYQPVDVRGMYDELDYQFTGMTSADRARMEAIQQAAAQIAQSGGGQGGGMDMGQVAQFAEMAGAKKGKKVAKSQVGNEIPGLGPTGPQLTPSAQNLQQQQFNWGTDYNVPAMPSPKKKPNLAKGIPVIGQVIGGIQNIKAQREAYRAAKQQTALTDVMGQAAASRPVQEPRRQYLRPEDMAFQPEQMFPSYGVGTNVLAEFGASVGGGEIMNTYAPGTLYDNLGYEPLNDSERYKQFYHGGKMHNAQGGEQIMQALGSSQGQQLANIAGGGTTGGYSEVLGSVGSLFGGPIGFATRFIGSAIDRLQEKKIENQQDLSRQNINKIVGQNFGIGVQQQFGANMEDGGMTSPYKWVSHTWQPQKIVSFGGHNVKDLLKPPHDADMLRAGGHLKAYTPPSPAAMSTERPMMQMGGELETHWGGYAEPMSYNPYLPDGGETIMFRGQSHDESDGRGNTGIGITYGENPVEVERGEPAVKLQDGGTGESNLTVFGNIKITNAFADMLADPKAKGKKFKSYVADLSKQENKQNKLIDKSLEKLDSMDVQTSFDKLAFGTLQANIEGANAKLKDLADKKINAASLQNAINDTKEENLLDVTDKGDVLAKKGVSIPKAQRGFSQGRANAARRVAAAAVNTSASAPTLSDDSPIMGPRPGVVSEADYNYLTRLYNDAKAQGTGDKVELFQKEFSRIAPGLAKQVLSEYDVTSFGKTKGFPKTDVRSNIDRIFGPRTERYKSLLDRSTFGELPRTKLGDLSKTAIAPKISATPTAVKTAPVTAPTKNNALLAAAMSQLTNLLRPSDVEALDPNQLLGELYAMSNNQVEPVQAQTFQPQLSVPYDISLQDILNENEASFRSQQRLMGYNPAAQSMLNAQKYQANQKVLGEQFRLNQAEKQRVYEQNRNLLNQAQIQNLGILDQQYVRQAQALSNTKATTQAALNSIASKYAQNKLENRTLATYENMYNYRFDPRFRAVNMNPLAQFDTGIGSAISSGRMSGGLAPGYEFTYDANGNIIGTRKSKSEDARNGSIVKKLKNL